jgi:hypothetical protein
MNQVKLKEELNVQKKKREAEKRASVSYYETLIRNGDLHNCNPTMVEFLTEAKEAIKSLESP